MRKKIGYLISRYPSISHTFILREVVELRRCGFAVDVASINAPDRHAGAMTAEERAEAEATFYIKPRGATGAFRAHAALLARHPLAYLRGAAFAISLGGLDARKIAMNCFYFVEAVIVGEWMRASDLKHLHVHFATPASTVALIASRIFPISFSITVHGPDEFYDAPGYLLREKIVAARLICAIGYFARSQLMKFCDPSQWGKIEVTPLGVDPSLFRPRPNPSDHVFEVVCVGRLVAAKGQQVLLAAIARLRSGRRSVQLRLVGDGPDRNALEASAQRLGIDDAVIFEGAVNQDHIRDHYGRADAFALASFAEGIPVVLMEAMAMEVPCIATWINGIPELLRDSIDGLLVAPSDADAMAAAIALLMDDEELRRRLGKAGRRRVLNKYNLGVNVARLAEVFDRYLSTDTELVLSAQAAVVP